MRELIETVLNTFQKIDTYLIEVGHPNESKYTRVAAQFIMNTLNNQKINDTAAEIEKSFAGNEAYQKYMKSSITEINQAKDSLDVADKEELCKLLESKIAILKVRESALPGSRPSNPMGSELEPRVATLG